jgi:RNA polymerase sigma-70 factor (sigma-E family)
MGSREETFERFVRESTAGFLRTAYLVTWDLAEAEDCVQEALVIAARHWRRIESMENPRAYVRTVLFRHALREQRRRFRRATDALTDDVADQKVAAEFESIDTRSEVLWLLQGLPRRQRAVLALRYFEDLSELEIAEQLGWPIGTVKSTASRALESLRQSLGDLDGGTSLPPTHPITHKEQR